MCNTNKPSQAWQCVIVPVIATEHCIYLDGLPFRLYGPVEQRESSQRDGYGV